MPSPVEAPDYSRARPVFIGGVGRSGTTLLRALLGSHSNIAMTPHEMDWWTRVYSRFRRGKGAAFFPDFVDWIDSSEKVRAMEIDLNEIKRELSSCDITNHGHLLGLLMAHYAKRSGKQRWGDKSTLLEFFADEIFEAFPRARFVYMLRDPRDVAASFQEAWFWTKLGSTVQFVAGHPAWTMAKWRNSVRLAERLEKRYPDRFRIVHYEELVTDPSQSVQRICEFIGEVFHSEMMNMRAFPRFREQGGTSSFGPLKGISQAPIGRYQSILSPAHIWMCEKVAGRLLQNHGYDRSKGALSLSDWLDVAWIMPSTIMRILLWSGLRIMRGMLPGLFERRPRPPLRRGAVSVRDDHEKVSDGSKL